MRIECAQASHPGRDPAKQINEDSAGYAQTPSGHLFVVCDGMGGHAGGRQASEAAIRTIFEHMAQKTGAAAGPSALRTAIEEAARRVFQLGGPAHNPYRPGSTCVSLLLDQTKATTAHVGDSRAFAIRGQRIFRLTRDHSLVQELVDSGALTEEQAVGHPDANKITRALGMTPEVEVELRADPLEVFAGDLFLLASDGLTDLVSTEDILAVTLAHIEQGGPQAVADTLVDLANERGGHDNITVQVVRVQATGPVRSTTLAQEPSAVKPIEPAAVERPELGMLRASDTVREDTSPTAIDITRAPARGGFAKAPGKRGDEITAILDQQSGAPQASAPPARKSKRPPPPARPGAAEPIAPVAPGPTIPGKPLEPRPQRVATTAPDRPLPTVVDPSLSDAPVVGAPTRAQTAVGLGGASALAPTAAGPAGGAPAAGPLPGHPGQAHLGAAAPSGPGFAGSPGQPPAAPISSPVAVPALPQLAGPADALRPYGGLFQPAPSEPVANHPLVYVVLVMAVVIGVLLVTLLWVTCGG